MQVNSDQWYVRWFLWNCRIMGQFLNSDRPHTRADRALRRGTDLCTFFRTILVGSLIVLANLGLWLYVLGVFFVAPFLLFNITTVAMTIGFVVAVIAGAFALVVVVIATPEAAKWAARKTRSAVAAAPDATPGFLQVCYRYLVGIKQRFCPTITIRSKEDV
jgi:hypothetical protein